jgi:hypothetical protein
MLRRRLRVIRHGTGAVFDTNVIETPLDTSTGTRRVELFGEFAEDVMHRVRMRRNVIASYEI